MAGELILIVDDNAINLKLVKILLLKEGYDIITAGDADEVLAALETSKPRLILMDIQLPGMNGLELTYRLKKEPATKDILIVAMTAYAMKGDDLKAKVAGCDGYITKPIDTQALPGIIKEYLKKSEL